MPTNKRFNKLKQPKQDEIKVLDRRPSKNVQDAGEKASPKQPAARKPTPAAQGCVTNPGIFNLKPPAKRKRPTPMPDDDDSVPTDSSNDGKQLTLIKLKRTIKRHARWCPFVRLNKKIRNRHRRTEAMIASFDSDGDSDDDQRSLPAAKKRRTKKSDPKPNAKPTGNDDDEDDGEDDGEDEDEDGDDDEQTARKKAGAASKEPQDPKSQEFENEGNQVEVTGDNDKEPTSATQREPKPQPKPTKAKATRDNNQEPISAMQREPKPNPNPKPTKASQKSANEADSAQLQQRKSNQTQVATKKSVTQCQGKASESVPLEAGPSVKPFASQKKIEDSPELGKRVKPAGELTDESDLPVAEKPVTETAGKKKGRAS